MRLEKQDRQKEGQFRLTSKNEGTGEEEVVGWLQKGEEE